MSKDTSAALLEGFFSYCPGMFFIAALDGGMSTWSDALGTALGPSFGQGISLAALAHPDDRAAVADAWSRLRQGTEPVVFHGRFADARGGHTALSCHARRAPGGDAIHGWLSAEPAVAVAAAVPVAAASGVDHADAATLASLRTKEHLLHGMMDSMPVVVWAIDASGIFTFHGGKGLERAGLSQGQFLGLNLFEIYKSSGIGLGYVKRALAGESLHYIDDEDQEITWENWLVPVRGTSGEVESLVGFTLDVTDAKRAEQELRGRLDLIEKQQEVIRNLSTPIIEVWDGVLTLPMVGMVDSIRTADVMDSLLRRIVETQSRFAILDLTGVEIVDTQVASHLIQLVSAIGLLGAEGIVAGIKPTVAQTMVALGLDLSQIVTQRNLRAALSYCLKRMNAASQPRADAHPRAQ